MAGGYVIDPASGLPAMQSASGALIPLPLSPDDMALAGAQLAGPPGLPPPPAPGPDQRTAALSMADVQRGITPHLIRPDQAAPTAADGIPRIQLPDPNAPPVWQGGGAPAAPPPMALPTREQVVNDARRAAGLVSPADPAELAQHRPAPTASQGVPQGGGRGVDPLTQQVFEEELRRGAGGGGPRRLGVTSETQKVTRPEAPIDPVLGAQANQAMLASDAYGEQLAQSLTARHQQAYEATQGEFAARAGQLQAQQERFERQQAMLQAYQAKRDELAAEAAQMKTPQMEDYWKSKGTMATMATAVSIVLGGALQGLRGGQNPGLEMSNQAIDRWINEQREAYQRVQGRVTDADNQYARMVQSFGSENLAIEHLREQAWMVRDNMLKSYAEKIGTPTALENYNQAMLQTEAQRAELRARASQGAMVEIEQKLSMQGGGGARPSLARALAAAAEAEKNRRVLTGEDRKPQAELKASDLKDVNNSDASLAGVRKMLGSYQGADTVPGLEDPNVISRGVRAAADFIGGAGSGSRLLDNEEERANKQSAENLVAGVIQSISGAGVSNEERERLTNMVRGARTKADLENIVNIIATKNAEFRRLAGGGASYAPADLAPSEEPVR